MKANKRMTLADKKAITALCKKGCTDSDIEDYCHEHGINTGKAFHFLSVQFAPEQCKGCKHVDMLPNIAPCNSCSRIYKDRYEKEEPKKGKEK